MENIKTYKPLFILFTTFISIIFLCMTSCSSSKALNDKCILKEDAYKEFVKTHDLENDINDFLKGN